MGQFSRIFILPISPTFCGQYMSFGHCRLRMAQEFFHNQISKKFGLHDGRFEDQTKDHLHARRTGTKF